MAHDLFKEIDLENIQVEAINEKSFEDEIIEHNLAKISTHLSENSNPKAYLQQFAKDRLKYKALGILLNHILNKTHHSKLYIEDVDFFIDTLFQLVNYGRKQLEFLEISKEDIHPSLIKGTGANKEGYSVLSAYESFLISTGSKKVLKYIFYNPTFDSQVLNQRFQVVGWMKQYLNDTGKYSKYFRSIHVLETILNKFGRMNVEEQQWRKLLKTLEGMLEIRNLFNIPEAPQIVKQYINHPQWSQLLQLFNVFKQTLDFSPFGIKNGVDTVLDQLKRTYDNMPHILTLIAKRQEWDFDFHIIFMAQIGYLIKINFQTELPEQFDLQNWNLQFSNRSGRFYSNKLTKQLDNEYGDVYGELQDIEKNILFEMQNLVIERQSIFLELYWKVCEIECFWGISQLSKNMYRPKISSEALVVSNGWHLLLNGNVIHNHCFSFCQASAPKQFVCNSQKNLVNTNYSNRCSVITGPNASGKTVYMKQLGIMVYLAHLGCFVPASFAQIPLFDSIAFVGKTESIYNSQQCGFESELLSLSSITQPNILSSKALVLIDEIGAEIDYQNSLKLLYTIIDYLTNTSAKYLKNPILSKKNDEFKTPFALIITHLSEILRSSIIEENYLIRFLTMSVQQTGLRIFKIKPGLVSKGYGIKMAAHILPQPIISRCQKYLALTPQL